MTSWEVSETYVKTQNPQVYSVYTDLGYATRSQLLCIDYCETASLVYYSFSVNDNGTQTKILITDDGKLMGTT